MPAGTRTFGLRETLIGPQVLPPPPTRHALLAFVVALAAVLHLGTAGWSDIHNGPEGYYAGSAREWFDGGAIPPGPPLLSWLLRASYAVVGTTAIAARLPIALATVAAVALTFLIGERIAGFWRGYLAALIHLCSLGTFVWGRLVTPDPVLAAVVAGALYCGVRGYQDQQTRRRWFAGVAACCGLACLTRGLAGLAYVAAIFILLALFFREARMRFRLLLSPPCLLVFLAVLLPWPVWLYREAPPAHGWASLLAFPPDGDGVPLARFVLQQLGWLFPGLALVLPGVAFAARKVFRPHEFDLADALPLCWAAVGLLPLLLLPGHQDHHAVAAWGGIALCVASAWDRTPPRLRIAGVGLTAIVVLGAMAGTAAGLLPAVFRGEATWNALEWMIISMGVLLLVAAAIAIYFLARGRETIALALLYLTMVPIGLSVAEGMVRFDAHFSLARAAAFLERRLGEAGEVLYEGAAAEGSSLRFYLDRPFTLVDEDAAIEKFSAPHPVYLIINKERVPFWQARLTEQFHLYHQETTCGEHVVLSNQP